VTDTELQAKLLYWQNRLRLRDWHITAAFSDIRKLAGCVGDSTVVWSSKSAHIRLMHEADYDPERLADSPIDGEEETLIHELLHCTFAGIRATDHTPESDLQHQAITALSIALLEEHRRTIGGDEARRCGVVLGAGRAGQNSHGS
jgi:hypothetical protein